MVKYDKVYRPVKPNLHHFREQNVQIRVYRSVDIENKLHFFILKLMLTLFSCLFTISFFFQAAYELFEAPLPYI